MSQVIKANAADVRFENVSKIYGKDAVAVGNIDLVVDAGTLVTLLGPSGCGKTTTLRMIAGLELPTSGKIFVGGNDVTDLPATAILPWFFNRMPYFRICQSKKILHMDWKIEIIETASECT